MKAFDFRPQTRNFLKKFHRSYLKFIYLGGQLFRLIYNILNLPDMVAKAQK